MMRARQTRILILMESERDDGRDDGLIGFARKMPGLEDEMRSDAVFELGRSHCIYIRVD